MSSSPMRASQQPEAARGSRPLRRDAARNRELLIAAAREAFAARGHEASLDDIARHAGLGVGTAYRHFTNKRELVAAIAEQEFEKVVELAEAAALEDEPWTALADFFEGVLQKQTANRGLREVVTGEHDAAHVDRVQDRLFTPLRRLLDRAKKAGQIRKDADVTDLGLIIAMLCAVTDSVDDVAPELWRRYLPMVMSGLRPGAEKFGAAPLTEAQMQQAMSEHKQRMCRPRSS